MNIEEINIGNILRCTGPLCGEVEVAVDGVQASGFVYSECNGFFVMLRVGGRDNSIRVVPRGECYDVEVFASHPQVVMTENSIKGVRYVHQLQNAYALATGGKLEIKVRKYEEQDLAYYPLLPT